MRGCATDPMVLLKILLLLVYLKRSDAWNSFGTIVINDDVMYESVLLNDCGDLASFIVSLVEHRGISALPGCCVNDQPRQLYNRSEVNLDTELRKMM